MKARYIERQSIVTTEEGIRLLEAGDIVEGESSDNAEVVGRPGVKPVNPGPEWGGGRPLEVITKEKRFSLSRLRANDKPVDMDRAIPMEIISRRRKLIMDRFKQERQQ